MFFEASRLLSTTPFAFQPQHGYFSLTLPLTLGVRVCIFQTYGCHALFVMDNISHVSSRMDDVQIEEWRQGAP